MSQVGYQRGFVIAIVSLSLALTSAVSAQRVFDRRYPKWPAPGRQAIASNVDRLLSPTLGFPELVQSGAVFEAHVELARAPDGRPIVPDVGDWLVYLVSAEGTAYRCTVEQVRAEGRFAVAKVRVALDLARDVYDLRVVTRGIDEYQPLAVRVLGRQRGQRFRLAVLSDHQLWDPSYRLSGRELSANLYTHEAKTTANEAIALQGLHELRLLDPDIVLHSGDLLYGLNYPQEYDEVYRLLRRARLPMLAVPGNHDLYPSRCRDDREGGPVYERLYGARSWGLEAGPALLVGLDTGAAWRADLEWPHAASWLAARPDRPWLLFTHRPPWDFDAAGAPAYVDLAALPDRWQARRPSLVVAGHLVGSVDVVRDGVRTIVNGDGGDVRGHGREPTWSLLRIEVAADGACSVRTVTLPRSRDAAVARDVLALRMARSRRRLPGALLAAPWRLLLAPFGRNVPVHRPPLRRDYPTRDEAAAWLATSRPFASLEVTS